MKPVPYSAVHRDEVLSLVGNRGARELLWGWQFESNPRGHAFEPVVISEGERVAAFNGVMPVRVRFQGEERDACWSCDFHVHPEYQGTGVGRRVKEELYRRHDLLMTFGVSPAAQRVLPRLGWQPSYEVRHYRFLRRAHSWRQQALRALQAAKAWRWRLLGRRSVRGGLLTIEATTHLPPASELDGLWHKVASGYRNIVCRDAAYLHWRYVDCPANGYRFLVVREAGALRGLAVYREDQETTRLVDLVAGADDLEAREQVVDPWLDMCPFARVAQVVTSDAGLWHVLERRGFFPGKRSAQFFVHCDQTEDAATGWFLMAGDSDGEFLQAGRDHVAREWAGDEAPLQVVRLTEDEILGEPERWHDLLERSDADRLFMGWAWQSSWWRTWKAPLGLEPCMVGVYRGHALAGLAPLYRYRRRGPFGRTTTELHVIGNAPRIAPTVRTEYSDFVVDSAHRDGVRDALARALKAMHWDVLIVCDHVESGHLDQVEKASHAMRSVRQEDWGVVLDTTGSFQAWLKQLGRNTRLKAYNRRTYLEKQGNVALRHAESSEEALGRLNAFHITRWGKPAFSGLSLEFHRLLLPCLPGDAEPRCSELWVNRRLCSVLYDVRVSARVYNLQAGFDESFDPKLSLGTLHLGYAIEGAFHEPAVTAYDLLAGGGKKTYYKGRFRGQPVPFRQVHLVRSRLLKAAYRFYDWLPEKARRPILRWSGTT